MLYSNVMNIYFAVKNPDDFSDPLLYVWLIGRVMLATVYTATAYIPAFREVFCPYVSASLQVICLGFAIVSGENYMYALENFSYVFLVNGVLPMLAGVDFRVHLFLELPLGAVAIAVAEMNFWGIISRESMTG